MQHLLMRNSFLYLQHPARLVNLIIELEQG